MKNLNEKYAQIVRENWAESIADGNKAREYMENSTAIYKGEPVACLFLPKILSHEAWEYLQKAAGTICAILDKVIAEYLANAEYRKLFAFERELEELILSEAGYSQMLPIARLDIFLNEEDFSFKFCEFNADGASAMNEDREIGIAVRQSNAFKKFAESHDLQTFELFDSWLAAFLANYAEYRKNKPNSPEKPYIVITDFMENATPNEFIQFRDCFTKAGYPTEIAEIRDLRYENGRLKTPDGKTIDAIYRRAVTRDIMERRQEVQPFLQAAKDGAVCIIGHFRTQVIHNKIIFKILCQPQTLQFLTETEREYILTHIPATHHLSTAKALENKDKWIIKPEDLYASKGVYAGVDATAEEWEKTVTQAQNAPYLLQEYHPPYRTQNLDFNGDPSPEFKTYNNITGMFVYNGKLQGVYSRAGQMGVISTPNGGLTLATMVARER